MSARASRLYRPAQIDDVEDLEQYRPGGLHPVVIGDAFDNARYTVLHKLGFGGSSTVWLAKEQPSGKLVTLKVLSAAQSLTPSSQIPDLYIPSELNKHPSVQANPAKEYLQVVNRYFTHNGPNGTHLCLISQFAGPSILSMHECPGRVSGSRRLRGDVARRASRQLASAVELLHSVGVVHGDLTSANILLKLRDEVNAWSSEQVYRNLGEPVEEDVISLDDTSPTSHAPSRVIAPVAIERLSSSHLLRDDILLIDFGQSFLAEHRPPHYEPATPLHYLSPEAFFDSQASCASDVWAVACAIFEIRAGAPLFDPFLGSQTTILKQIVETLGRLPDPWWDTWDARKTWFDEMGIPKPEDEQRREGVLLTAVKSPLSQKLKEIGEQYDEPEADEGPLIEDPSTRLQEEEIELLVDLLGKMLRYEPRERVSMAEVIRHPWFQWT